MWQHQKHVQEKQKNVVLSGSVFHVQGLPFFITMSQNTLFTTTEMLKNRKLNTLIEATDHVLKLHNGRDFAIQAMNMDQEFDKDDCRNALLERGGIHLNCAATKEHVGQIEQNVCTAKERCHATQKITCCYG